MQWVTHTVVGGKPLNDLNNTVLSVFQPVLASPTVDNSETLALTAVRDVVHWVPPEDEGGYYRLHTYTAIVKNGFRLVGTKPPPSPPPPPQSQCTIVLVHGVSNRLAPRELAGAKPSQAALFWVINTVMPSTALIKDSSIINPTFYSSSFFFFY